MSIGTIVLSIVPAEGAVHERIIVDIPARQDVDRLELGMAEIFGRTSADRIWVRHGEGYQTMGDGKAPSTVGDHLQVGHLYDAVLSEHPPPLSGKAA